MDKSPPSKLCKLIRESTVDWKEIIQTCKTHKHYARKKDWKSRTCLHIACLKNTLPPLNALKAIVKANTSALLSPDMDGMLPIHYICMVREGEIESSTSVHIVNILDVLIHFCPESILIQDRKGCTPLHKCCEAKRGIPILRCLLDADHTLNGDATELGSSSLLTVQDEMRRTALHFAVIHGSDTQILTALIDWVPRTLEMEDVRGFYVLHYACSYLHVNTNAVRLLLGKNKRISRIRCNTGLSCLDLLTRTYKKHLDTEKRLAIKYIQHNRCQFKINFAKDEVTGFSTTINQYWDKAIMVASGASLGRILHANRVNHDAPLFIHDLIRLDRCPFTLIAMAITKYPNWLAVKDDNGNLPLHTVASKFISRRCRSNHSRITKLILHGYRQACKEKNNDGKYPLNLAIDSGKGWTWGIHDIFDEFPEALDLQELDVRLYPFIFSRVATDVSKLNKLITLFPTVITS